MFSTDAMEYGVFPLDYPVPEGFCWAYPTRCGYEVAARSPAAVTVERSGLFLYILEGEGEARCGGQRCAYAPDCVVTASDGASLRLYPLEKTEYLYLVLQNAGELLERVGFVRAIGPDGRADRMLGRICYHASQKRPGTIYRAAADVFSLLMEVCERCGEGRARFSPLVREAIGIMREEYAFLAGVDELASRLGVTKSHLIRAFSAATGVSPGKYLQSVKLDNAKLMLQNRDYSIEMVADMAGYSGANYFCKVFRRATGESPGEYRARNLAPAALDVENRRRLEELEGIYHV